jgi:uncharacterized protein
MTFAADYLCQLEAFAALSPFPGVKALHLPPLGQATDNRGEFCAIELEDGAIGLSYVLLDDTLKQLHARPDQAFRGADALALARRYGNGQGCDRVIGFATANALTRCLYDQAGFRPDKSSNSIGDLNPQAGEHIGMIGMFSPLVRRITDAGAQLTVVELKAELVGSHDNYCVTLDASELLNCSKVISTSTLLLNDTLDYILENCQNARWLAMLGPNAGCLPDALFTRGISFLGGSWITDGPGFLAGLISGESRSNCAEKYALSPANYPGFDRLLTRIQENRRR